MTLMSIVIGCDIYLFLEQSNLNPEIINHFTALPPLLPSVIVAQRIL